MTSYTIVMWSNMYLYKISSVMRHYIHDIIFFFLIICVILVQQDSIFVITDPPKKSLQYGVLH